MTHLFELLDQIPENTTDELKLPAYLMGSFRRKSITFHNGLTDEQTLVYWFQSGSFSIDLRLSDAHHTPITDRQGWIGTTLWNPETQLLSWDIQHSYQTRIQWPEPAQLYPIGNCILEFAPSKAYMEDWRQQADHGRFVGLRLTHAENIQSQERLDMDGGLIISGELMAYVQSRIPEIQQKCHQYDDFSQAIGEQLLTQQDINQYETSVSLHDTVITYSTIDARIGQSIDLDHFELLPDGLLRQRKLIEGVAYYFYYSLDFYCSDFNFVTQSCTNDAALQWFAKEHQHLFQHAQVVL